MDPKEFLKKLTLEEKAELCTGGDFWHTKAVERLGLPAVMMSDGPSGLRKQNDAADHLGINDSIRAVCFPASASLASSFDVELARRLGRTLGQECQAENLAMLLGPGLNIKRSPLCGRNFEYYSEDPALAGQMGTALVEGLQSTGAASCIKHFAANSQETDRMVSDSVMDERTLHEIYLPAFETVVKQAKPRAVMCAYNKLNGTFCSESKELLTDILRTRWGYEGMVVTDWGAVKDRAKGVAAGLDLEMPGGSRRGIDQVLAAVKDGTLREEQLDQTALRVLEFVCAALDAADPQAVFDREADYQTARQIAAECAVLLKNDRAVLPLAEGETVALIGDFAASPRYQGGGSSHVNSARVSAARDCMPAGMTWTRGYDQAADLPDAAQQAEAVRAAQNAGAAVILAGLPERYESEGVDRTTLEMPANQNALIEAVAAVQPNTVVVLYNGAPVTMPWLDKVAAVLEMYLPGDAGGQATLDLLYGRANPSGKLAETFPQKLEDTPAYLNFPGENAVTEYREGIFVGYRYYDKKRMDVLFPFGHGLSYTSFAYSDLTVDRDTLTDADTLTVCVTVTNTGSCFGKEAVQLYIAPPAGMRQRPVRELKAFAKAALEPGQSQTLEFTLTGRDFAYYEPLLHDFYAESGRYGIEIGASSRDIRLRAAVALLATRSLPRRFTEFSTLADVMAHPSGAAMLGPILQRMAAAAGQATGADGVNSQQMLKGILLNTLVSFGVLSDAQLQGILQQLNQ